MIDAVEENHGRLAHCASNAVRSSALTGGNASTTRLAQSKYSRRRCKDQLTGGAPATSFRLHILSASLTSAASRETRGACSTCSSLRRAVGSFLSSVTSATILATC